MNEDEYIARLRAHWPRGDDVESSPMAIDFADEAVKAFPRSARLWVLRGNLIEMGPETYPYPLEESLTCYKRAIEIDPRFAEAWEDAAHFYDAVLDDEAGAALYFKEFERLTGRSSAWPIA